MLAVAVLNFAPQSLECVWAAVPCTQVALTPVKLEMVYFSALINQIITVCCEIVLRQVF